ncbi:carbohydrate ABC transporter permease [Paenibacillus sp. GCM10027626]|uniref:carbohydrate ABC transporter permease n=1 Tax=Paenibacillus sp. GCM10027626 TaxID=3273411 RepID=UPI00363556E8
MTAATANALGRSRSGGRGGKIVSHFFLVLFGIVFAAPLCWLLLTSIKSDKELYANPPVIVPPSPRWANYADVFREINFIGMTWNTLFISLLCVIGIMFSAPLVAYACSHIDWKGKKLIFALVIATLLLPYQVTMIPTYMIWNKLGMIGTYVPLVLPAFLSAGAGYYIFLLRQFFMTIPPSLIQSAKIDGASELRIYAQILLPLSKPIIATVGVLIFLATWSDFLGPLLYLNNEKHYTLSLGLYAFMQTHYVMWEKLMAASAMFTLPIIVLFFFAQKQFIEGITLTGIKA